MAASPFIRVAVLALALATGTARAAEAKPAGPPATAQILLILQVQADAWNRGDLDAFMQTYAPVDDLRFASGGSVTYGWKPTLERYKKRYPDRAAMGTLAFSDLAVTELSPDAAIVFGHWRLTRAADAPHGLFTLLVRRTPAGWKIFADHTSSATP
ncbi:MAG: YybH family protein [Opitutales bacterium]